MTKPQDMHGPHDKPLIDVVAEDYDSDIPYAPRPIMVEVTTLSNGTYDVEVTHDDLLTLLARYGDHLIDEGARPYDDLPFLATRVAISHVGSDRDTGSSVQTWNWPHDLVDEILRRALNQGYPLVQGSSVGPWDDGTFVTVMKVVTTLPEI